MAVSPADASAGARRARAEGEGDAVEHVIRQSLTVFFATGKEHLFPLTVSSVMTLRTPIPLLTPGAKRQPCLLPRTPRLHSRMVLSRISTDTLLAVRCTLIRHLSFPQSAPVSLPQLLATVLIRLALPTSSPSPRRRSQLHRLRILVACTSDFTLNSAQRPQGPRCQSQPHWRWFWWTCPPHTMPAHVKLGRVKPGGSAAVDDGRRLASLSSLLTGIIRTKYVRHRFLGSPFALSLFLWKTHIHPVWPLYGPYPLPQWHITVRPCHFNCLCTLIRQMNRYLCLHEFGQRLQPVGPHSRMNSALLSLSIGHLHGQH
ncbi:hypothetical protein B0H12DRAFT_46313 [Mycena haematopus]|nr:hypothetical protein B0H12DRAFT_46313 [Mycena haematopus]